MTEYILSAVAFYRAFQDAGIWMIDKEAITSYLESFVFSRGMV